MFSQFFPTGLWVIAFVPSRPCLPLTLFLNCHLDLFRCLSLHFPLTLLLPVSPSPSLQRTGAIVKHWPKSQALRRLRGSGLTDRWISPQAPRTGIVEEAFPSHWDPCGLGIPGFCWNNKASHTAKRKYWSKALHCFYCRRCALHHFAPFWKVIYLFLTLSSDLFCDNCWFKSIAMMFFKAILIIKVDHRI